MTSLNSHKWLKIKMKRIVFIQHRMGNGGVSYSLSTLLFYLVNKLAINITLVLRYRDENPRMDLIPNGVKQIWLDECGENFFLDRFDVVIAYMPDMADILVHFKNVNKKIIWVHGDYSVFDTAIQATVIESVNKADDVITPSSKASKAIIDLVPQYKNKVFTIPHMMKDDLIKKLAYEPIHDWPVSPIPTIVTVGKLFYNAKGLDRMIRIHRRLLDQNIIFQWIVIGDGPDRSWIEQMIAENQLESRFILLGFRENPYPYIQKADIFAILSYHEGYSLVLCEAKILGRPIICTEFAGAADQIQNMQNGMIVENTDAGIEEGLKEIVSNSDLRQILSQNLNGYQHPNNEIIKEINRLFFG